MVYVEIVTAVVSGRKEGTKVDLQRHCVSSSGFLARYGLSLWVC